MLSTPSASNGTGPGGGQAAKGWSDAPVPSTHVHEYPVVDPMPIGPSRFDSSHRRCPSESWFPRSTMYMWTAETAEMLAMLLRRAASAPGCE